MQADWCCHERRGICYLFCIGLNEDSSDKVCPAWSGFERPGRALVLASACILCKTVKGFLRSEFECARPIKSDELR